MSIRSFVAISALALFSCVVLCAQSPGGEGFPSPQAAAKALVNASRNNDVKEVINFQVRRYTMRELLRYDGSL